MAGAAWSHASESGGGEELATDTHKNPRPFAQNNKPAALRGAPFAASGRPPAEDECVRQLAADRVGKHRRDGLHGQYLPVPLADHRHPFASHQAARRGRRVKSDYQTDGDDEGKEVRVGRQRGPLGPGRVNS